MYSVLSLQTQACMCMCMCVCHQLSWAVQGKGFGYVHLRSAEDVFKVLSLTELPQFLGRPLRISACQSERAQTLAKASTHMGVRAKLGKKPLVGASRRLKVKTRKVLSQNQREKKLAKRAKKLAARGST